MMTETVSIASISIFQPQRRLRRRCGWGEDSWRDCVPPNLPAKCGRKILEGLRPPKPPCETDKKILGGIASLQTSLRNVGGKYWRDCVPPNLPAKCGRKILEGLRPPKPPCEMWEENIGGTASPQTSLRDGQEDSWRDCVPPNLPTGGDLAFGRVGQHALDDAE